MDIITKRLLSLITIITLLASLSACDFIESSTKAANLSRDKSHDVTSSIEGNFDTSRLIENWGSTYKSWQSTLDSIDTTLNRYSLSKNQIKAAKINEYLQQVNDIKKESQQVSISLTNNQNKVEMLLQALQIDEEETESIEETYQIKTLRENYQRDLAQNRDRIKLIELTQVRCNQLYKSLNNLSQNYLIKELSVRTLPKSGINGWMADIRITIDNTQAFISNIYQWVKSAINVNSGNLIAVLALFILPFIASYVIRYLVSTTVGYRSKNEAPRYHQRLIATFSEGLSKIIFPLLLLWLLYSVALPYVFGSDLSMNPTQSAAHAFIIGIFVFVLFAIIPIRFAATLTSPKFDKWRIDIFDFLHSKKISSRIFIFSIIFAMHLMLDIWQNHWNIPSTTYYLITLTFIACEIWAAFRLLPKSLWVADDDNDNMLQTHPLVSLARKALFILLPLSFIAALFGYLEAGNYILRSGLLSFGIIVLFQRIIEPLLSDILHNTITQPKFREAFDLKIVSLQRIKNIARIIISPLLFVVSAFIVLRLWGVPNAELRRYASLLIDGFQIGSITISLTSIFFAIGTFILVMYIFHAIRKYLLNSFFPETGLTLGSQHAISAGVGYLGFIIAILMAIAAAGVEMKNIALVASALSIGIGFGLREIVSNFVSGIILIAERPIKVGDWVRIGDEEGTVKEINFRSTEIETFKKSNVIIPNSQILTSSVVNMTHRNDIGRIDIEIGIGYGENIEEFKQIALDVMNNNEFVAKYPKPKVFFMNHGDSALQFKLQCFTNNITKSRLKLASTLRSRLHEALKQDNIEIPFPQVVMHRTAETPKD